MLDCQHTQILEQRVQAGPEDRPKRHGPPPGQKDHSPRWGAGTALCLTVSWDPHRKGRAMLKGWTLFSENQLYDPDYLTPPNAKSCI